MLHTAARYTNSSALRARAERNTRFKAAALGVLASMSSCAYKPARAPIVVAPTAPHSSSIIWLHGLGDTGAGWADAASEFAPALPGTRMVFPTAHMRPVTLNGNMTMTAWFDIASLSDIDNKEDAAGMNASVAYVESLIAAEVAAGVSPSRIVLAGFSQGGAVALHTGLRSTQPLGGILALSTWLPFAADYPGALGEGGKATTVNFYHGTMDPVVRTEYGRRSYDRLKQLGVNASWSTYQMAHSAHPDELKDIRTFLQARLG